MDKLTRRGFIQAGVAGLAAASVARPSVAATAFFGDQIDPRLRSRALLALEANRQRIYRPDVIGIVDFNQPSREHRFYLLDVASGRVTSHYVAHGRGSDPSHLGWLQYFSNGIGSEASSRGAYSTGEFYNGKYGYSMRLRGLDYTNNNAETRAIVIHPAWYAERDQIDQYGKLGRSEGCFALPHASHAEVLARMGPGRLLYADRV